MFRAAKKPKPTDRFRVQPELFLSGVNIVKQISVCLGSLWHFQQFTQQSFAFKAKHCFAQLNCMLSSYVKYYYSHTVPRTRRQLSARWESVSWRQRQETPSLMAGEHRFHSPLRGNYRSWHRQELKFNLHDVQSLRLLSYCKNIISANTEGGE